MYSCNDTELKKIPFNVADWWLVQVGKIWKKSLAATQKKRRDEKKFRSDETHT